MLHVCFNPLNKTSHLFLFLFWTTHSTHNNILYTKLHNFISVNTIATLTKLKENLLNFQTLTTGTWVMKIWLQKFFHTQKGNLITIFEFAVKPFLHVRVQKKRFIYVSKLKTIMWTNLRGIEKKAKLLKSVFFSLLLKRISFELLNFFSIAAEFNKINRRTGVYFYLFCSSFVRHVFTLFSVFSPEIPNANTIRKGFFFSLFFYLPSALNLQQCQYKPFWFVSTNISKSSHNVCKRTTEQVGEKSPDVVSQSP